MQLLSLSLSLSLYSPSSAWSPGLEAGLPRALAYLRSHGIIIGVSDRQAFCPFVPRFGRLPLPHLHCCVPIMTFSSPSPGSASSAWWYTLLLYRSCTVATVDKEFTICFLGIYFGLSTRGPDLDSAVFVGPADQPVDADHHDDHEDAHQHHVQQVHLSQ